ncbi:hypothetical protein [Archangium sp.]|jgi:hypothetical protein|uniref:hypothetical protein n=1 Tax=Archangium sp. TaxID=1872627 RepID=UPI002EDB2412
MSRSSTSTDPFEGGDTPATPPLAHGKPENRKPLSLSRGIGYYAFFLVLLVGAAFLPRCGWLCESQGVSCVQEQSLQRADGSERPDAGVASPDGGPTLADGGVASAEAGETTTGTGETREVVNPVHVCMSDCALVYYVILLGVLGGWLHGVSSMATFAGVKKLDESWWTFYLTRPLVGGATALLVYFALQSGIAGFSIPTDLWRGQMALLAWAGIAGLSSTVVMRKMRDVLDALFKPNDPLETRQQQPKPSEQAETMPPSVADSSPTTPVATKPDVQTPAAPLAPKPPGKPPAGGP